MQIAFLSYKLIVLPGFAIGRFALENLSGVETTASAEFPPSPVLVSVPVLSIAVARRRAGTSMKTPPLMRTPLPPTPQRH